MSDTVRDAGKGAYAERSVSARVPRSQVPQKLYKSLAWDGGQELTAHERFTLTCSRQYAGCGSNFADVRPRDPGWRQELNILGYSQASLDANARKGPSSLRGSGPALGRLPSSVRGSLEWREPCNCEDRSGNAIEQDQRHLLRACLGVVLPTRSRYGRCWQREKTSRCEKGTGRSSSSDRSVLHEVGLVSELHERESEPLIEDTSCTVRAVAHEDESAMAFASAMIASIIRAPTPSP